MNKVILMGRLTRDPDIRTVGANNTKIARYSLAVDKTYKKDGESNADFINCICFGKTAEFAEKYLNKGTRIAVEGSISTGSYTNKDGAKVYTFDINVERHEFVESTKSGGSSSATYTQAADGFMNIPGGIEEELPFD